MLAKFPMGISKFEPSKDADIVSFWIFCCNLSFRFFRFKAAPVGLLGINHYVIVTLCESTSQAATFAVVQNGNLSCETVIPKYFVHNTA